MASSSSTLGLGASYFLGSGFFSSGLGISSSTLNSSSLGSDPGFYPSAPFPMASGSSPCKTMKQSMNLGSFCKSPSIIWGFYCKRLGFPKRDCTCTKKAGSFKYSAVLGLAFNFYTTAETCPWSIPGTYYPPVIFSVSALSFPSFN